MRKIFLLILCVISIPAFLLAEQKGINLSIRYFDKAIYYPNSSIRLKIELANDSPDTFRFKVADEKLYNLDFDVRTLSNQVQPYSENYKDKRDSNQTVFFREMSLQPGEVYAVIADLADYVVLDKPDMYILSAKFFPVLSTLEPQNYLASNQLSLSIRPGLADMETLAKIDVETGNILRETALAPDQVVAYTIQARQKSQWEKFFLYLDLESLYLSNFSRKERYMRLSQEDRIKELDKFKNSLKESKVDNDIVVIPTEFTILKTEYTQEKGTVQVLQKFAYSGFTENKRYTYYLKRRDTVWYIYNYEVKNLGTE